MWKDSDRRSGIQMHESTMSDLEALKIHPRETYEDVIVRLVQDYRKHHAPRKQEDDPPAGQTTFTKQEA